MEKVEGEVGLGIGRKMKSLVLGMLSLSFYWYVWGDDIQIVGYLCLESRVKVEIEDINSEYRMNLQLGLGEIIQKVSVVKGQV